MMLGNFYPEGLLTKREVCDRVKGMTFPMAFYFIEMYNYTYRVVDWGDGTSVFVAADYVPHRIDLYVKDTYVVKAE